VRSTGKLIKAKVELDNGFANVDLQEDEYGISPGQACVFYSKDENGYKVLDGGWVTK
jgi:tRNA-specific 2-thiouridylase